MLNLIDLECLDKGEVIAQAEALAYDWALQHCRYNQTKAAKLLGVSRGCLRMKLKKYFGTKYIRNSEDML